MGLQIVTEPLKTKTTFKTGVLWRAQLGKGNVLGYFWIREDICWLKRSGSQYLFTLLNFKAVASQCSSLYIPGAFLKCSFVFFFYSQNPVLWEGINLIVRFIVSWLHSGTSLCTILYIWNFTRDGGKLQPSLLLVWGWKRNIFLPRTFSFHSMMHH